MEEKEEERQVKGVRNRVAGGDVWVLNHGFHGLRGLGEKDNPCNQCNPWLKRRRLFG